MSSGEEVLHHENILLLDHNEQADSQAWEEPEEEEPGICTVVRTAALKAVGVPDDAASDGKNAE
jgi:hypothetical protein